MNQGNWETDNKTGIVSVLLPTTIEDEATDTLDLTRLFPEEVTVSGSYDLRHMKGVPITRLLEALSVPTLLISKPQTIEYANGAFASMVDGGLDVRDMDFSSLFPNARRATVMKELLETVFEGREPAVKETALQIGQTRIWGRLHLQSVRLLNEKAVLAQIENLTAQKELLSVNKYKKLVNIFPIGIAEFAVKPEVPCRGPIRQLLREVMDARLVDGNSEFAGIYGKTNIEDLGGVALGSLYPGTRKARKVCEQWIESGFDLKPFDTSEAGFPEEIRHFENTLIANVDGRYLLGFWWLKREVTENKRMQEEILRAGRLESLGILAGGIAHDFNNLLTAMLGNITLSLKQLDKDHKAYGRLELAVKAASRAQNLTLQLLPFSKGGAPIKTSASIGELLEECVTFALRGSSVSAHFDIPEDLWPVEMDEGQISQVVNNLIINAAHSMPKGGVVKVRGENVALTRDFPESGKGGRHVKISVSDRGYGIPRENLSKIFDPYFTTKDNGTGLGLSTSYSIITKHGGTITVESEMGIGTTVTFRLPASSMKPLPKKQNVKVAVEVTGKILVMDDEEMIRDLSGELLRALGYQATEVRDGEEAIASYCESMESGRPFDVVIMDLTIQGGMGGKETMRRLREIDPDVNAIVASGYSNDPIMSNYRKYGFKAVLPKPYDVDQLAETLRGLLKGSSHLAGRL
jgi:signal transduction histidine kinase/CheY-like chemotaxis protein